jgi:hypothetical protein
MHRQIFWRGVTRAAALAIVLGVTGCAPQLQTQMIGRTTGMATLAATPLATELPVPESTSTQVLRYVVSLPRAVQLRYQLACPTAQRDGTLGETFDRYRDRRLAELERERQAQAKLIGSLVGAVAPPARATAGVSGPGGSATATAEVNPGAAATAVADQSLPPPQLPPGDTGAQVVQATVDLGATPAGKCALTLAPDPPEQDALGTHVLLELVRIVDVEAEERARQAALRVEQDRRARELRVWLVGALQHRGADPNARARARALAEEDQRRRAAAAAEEDRRRAAVAEEDQRRRVAAAAEEDRRRQEVAWRKEQERQRSERMEQDRREHADAALRQKAAAARQANLSLRLTIVARLQGLGADPGLRARREAERQRAAEQERLRLAQQEALRQQQQAQLDAQRRQQQAQLDAERARQDAERARQQAQLDARRAQQDAERAQQEARERDRLAALERERLAALARQRETQAVQEAERQARIEIEASERRLREWHARQASFALRQILAGRLVRLGADPQHRQRLEEARLVARREAERRAYDERARGELQRELDRRAAVELRFRLAGRLTAMGADPEFRRKRDAQMFLDLDAEARRQEVAQREASERVRAETQAALDLRVQAKLRLKLQGAVDRPPCPPPVAETPPPAPFASAIWIPGRHDWNGIAWVWASGHYEQPPQADAIWVPPLQLAVSGTVVVRPGRWVRVTIAPR